MLISGGFLIFLIFPTILLASQKNVMPKIQVKRTVSIDKPASDVYAILSNLEQWKPWSPWLISEREAVVKVSDDKKFQEWEGKVVGSGQLQIANEVENKEINLDLTFLKPWKSRAKTSFYLNEKGNSTQVTWTMDSSLPFFMFWMKKMMTEMIGMDYDRGLTMLKEYVEIGKVNSELKVLGEHNYPSKQYIGIHRTTDLNNIGDAMKEDYEKLMPYMMENHQDKVDGNAFSIYHKWDPVKKVVEYTACVPVKSDVPLQSGMIKGTYSGGKMYSCEHTGPYKYAGNVWSAMYGRKMAKVFKENKKVHPIEEYLNSPTNTPENELKSVVRFAVK